MEETVDSPGAPEPKKRSGMANSKFIAAAIIVTMVLLIATLTIASLPAPDNPRPDHWVLVSGDELRYSISGSSNATTFSGTATYKLLNYSHVSGMTFISSKWEHNGTYPQDDINDTMSAHSSVSVKMIGTPYGQKYVREEVSPSAERVIIRSVGVESLVPYRINVSGPDHYLSMNLVNLTNASRLSSLDDNGVLKAIDQPPSLDFKPPAQHGFCPGSGGLLLLSLPRGGEVNYTFSGNNSSLYVFSSDNIETMARGGHLEYDESLSAVSTNKSKVAVLGPGVYYINIDVPADSEENAWMQMELDVY